MDAKIKELLTRLSFFAEDGMTDKPIVEIAKQADALLLEEARKPNTQQPVAWQYREFYGENTVTPGWSKWHSIESEKWAGRSIESVISDIRAFIDQGYGYEIRELYTAPPAPPVPRDVLMAAMMEVCGWIDANDPCPDLNEIADRYASKVQPEPTRVLTDDELWQLFWRDTEVLATGAIVGLKEALRRVHQAGAVATKPEPVNQQMLAALKESRQFLTMDRPINPLEIIAAAIAAAEEAQPVEYVTVQEAWLAAGGNPGISASKEELISALHAMDEAIDDSETAQQPASAQPVAVPAIRELTDDELLAIRNHVAINEVMRDDDSRTICIKQGRAVIRAMLSAAQKPVAVPDEMTPAMMRAVQLRTELGAYTAANLSGAYDLFAEFWRVALEEAKKGGAA